ncbi:MAG: CRISPR-associated helicase Cas3' [Candidatus Bipolaricaulis sp.]|nr:CRISPR-associated helicase Cas3' [Candidatus Bipolaricaulis sp.]
MNSKSKTKKEECTWTRLWGKTGPGETYHPLIFHMLDVAAVAERLWDHHLGSGLRRRLACSLGASSSRSLLALVAGAHDIGKASPGFQRKSVRLRECLPLSWSEYDHDRPHGLITARILRECMGASREAAVLAQIAGGHHGIFPRSGGLRFGSDTLGGEDWRTAQLALLAELQRLLAPVSSSWADLSLPVDDPFFVPVLSGIISIADWIGSNQDFFPCSGHYGEAPGAVTDEYWESAKSLAKTALDELGWSPSVSFAGESSFDAVFPGFAPNLLQDVVIRLTSGQASPYLMIIEAPMGSGKTEAALYAADLSMCRGFARGMYVAMPTQATGNAMFQRVMDYLKRRGHAGRLNLQLVHGNALLARTREVAEGEIPDVKPSSVAETDGDIDAQSWFTAKKRPLLAPFGVGTIDQSLLSVLQTKHWFVRLFGLAGKVVIFDEVHAYDDYMRTILQRLLHWLAELDCTVILLSATLPEAKRQALAFAYSGREHLQMERYPRITLVKPRRHPSVASEGPSRCVRIPKERSRAVLLELSSTDLESLSKNLAHRLESGGCAAVICNTVNRSIEVCRHLQARLEDTDCSLFHARTLQGWRREREAEVLRAFGKGERQSDGTYTNPHRPHRAALVATQVVEQSLDLDFDLMISEIAPIDLLLQRLGRLHRHLRRRPGELGTPRFVLLSDAEPDGRPPDSFGRSTEYVYDRYILLRTRMALLDREEILIPDDIEPLVEAVYGSDVTPCCDHWSAALTDAKAAMEHAAAESQKAAARLLVKAPSAPEDLLEGFNPALVDDEDPEVNKALRAATRQGPPSITAVFLEEGRTLSPKPETTEIRELLDRSAKISHVGLFHTLVSDGEQPEEWSDCAHLRHARLLRLDRWNQAEIGSYVITVDERLGIVIAKEGEDTE